MSITYAQVNKRHGLPVQRVPPPSWLVAPLRVLTALGGEVFQGRVPSHLAYLEGSQVELALYPSGLLIRGPKENLGRAHGVIVEGLSDLDAWQTFDPRAQAIERQISRLWQAYRQRPSEHRNSAPLLSRLREIAGEIEALPVGYDEWQVVYRKALQVRFALHGESQLLDRPEDREKTMPQYNQDGSARVALKAEVLSTRSLIHAITSKAYLLTQKEVALARAELVEDIRSELAMAQWLAVAAGAGLVGVTLLLVALVLAVAPHIRGSVAAELLGVGLVVLSATVGLMGWHRRVRSPLAVTRKTVKENWQWVKERLA